MNIFFVDQDPVIAAQSLCNKHICKQVLEATQLLSGVHHVYQTALAKSGRLYRATHINHPCAIWARESYQNYQWLYWHGLALAGEYTYRYKKIHKCEEVLFLCTLPPRESFLRNLGLTPPAQAMPEQYRGPDPVEAYRRYYNAEKARFAQWVKRKPPDWFICQ